MLQRCHHLTEEVAFKERLECQHRAFAGWCRLVRHPHADRGTLFAIFASVLVVRGGLPCGGKRSHAQPPDRAGARGAHLRTLPGPWAVCDQWRPGKGNPRGSPLVATGLLYRQLSYPRQRVGSGPGGVLGQPWQRPASCQAWTSGTGPGDWPRGLAQGLARMHSNEHQARLCTQR